MQRFRSRLDNVDDDDDDELRASKYGRSDGFVVEREKYDTMTTPTLYCMKI